MKNVSTATATATATAIEKRLEIAERFEKEMEKIDNKSENGLIKEQKRPMASFVVTKGDYINTYHLSNPLDIEGLDRWLGYTITVVVNNKGAKYSSTLKYLNYEGLEKTIYINSFEGTALILSSYILNAIEKLSLNVDLLYIQELLTPICMSNSEKYRNFAKEANKLPERKIAQFNDELYNNFDRQY